MTFYLGVDAGGSNCRARLVDAAGAVLGEALVPGTANASIGADALHAKLLDVVGRAMAAAHLPVDRLGEIHAGLGIAGLGRAEVRAELAALPFGFASVAFATDALVANLGAHGGRDGAILIVGTGSAVQLRVNGEDFTLGGYGFPISDEGSGAALGLSAMRHALRALDGRTRATELSLAVSERWNHDAAQAIAWMDGATPRDYGAFAPLVMDHAEAGDPNARAIVEEAASHLERFIDTIFARGAPACALVGGLAPRMGPWLRARTVARLVEPEGDPLDGALLLAGLPVSPRPGPAATA